MVTLPTRSGNAVVFVHAGVQTTLLYFEVGYLLDDAVNNEGLV